MRSQLSIGPAGRFTRRRRFSLAPQGDSYFRTEAERDAYIAKRRIGRPEARREAPQRRAGKARAEEALRALTGPGAGKSPARSFFWRLVKEQAILFL